MFIKLTPGPVSSPGGWEPLVKESNGKTHYYQEKCYCDRFHRIPVPNPSLVWFAQLIGNKNLYFDISIYYQISDKNTYSEIFLVDVYKILELILSRDLDFIGPGSKSKVLELWPKTRATKNNVTSETCRERGNLCLKMNQVNEAIEQYNESVLFAEFDSRPYALALANRAMAWMKVRVSI